MRRASIALVMMLAGTVGAFMSSSAIVAMFIPVVLAIANKIGLNRKRMLMPLSIAALISGMMTLIASSPNMIVEDTLRARGLAPLSFFSWTPFGVAVLAAAIFFMLVAGRNMLSKQTTAEEAGAGQPSAYDLLGSYGLADKWHRLQVPRSSPLIGRSGCADATARPFWRRSRRLRETSAWQRHNSCRHCLRPCSSPMTRSSPSVTKNRRNS